MERHRVREAIMGRLFPIQVAGTLPELQALHQPEVFLIPANAGIQENAGVQHLYELDARLRGHDVTILYSSLRTR